jgi:hypothetical protein
MSDSLAFWAFSDAHVGTDRRSGRDSLADAIRQAESAFAWDFALDLGDMSGGQSVPADDEGEEIARQFTALGSHRREDIYSLAGNHDRSGLDEPPNWWWRKWLDPTGDNSRYSGIDRARRRYPVEGTWERYSFRVGNVLFLMMSDINEPSRTIGRGALGGNPGGVVSADTFTWWKRMVEANQESIIVCAHHYVLKNTTVASGEYEGCRRGPDGQWVSHYHGCRPQGTPQGASYLYWVGSQPDAQAFERYLAEHPGAVDVWLGGHTHTNPDDRYGGKSHVETKWGVHFVNVSALTKFHVRITTVPMSRPMRIEGDQFHVGCYLHTSDYAPQGPYSQGTRALKLRKRFSARGRAQSVASR